MRRILLKIQYDGTNYSGWQRQPLQKTVQGEIEEAIFKAIGEQVEVFGSGRTDAGVHALGQTAHFDLIAPVPIEKIKDILNNVLPKDISILEAKEVDNDFHARFSIKKKCYVYKIYNSEVKNVFFANRTAWVRKNLDVNKMNEIKDLLIGEHNFQGFCSSNTNVQSFVREIFSISINRIGDFIDIEVCGSGFLYNMVRIIVGTFVDYALGKITKEDIEMALKNGDRSKSGETMPPSGLYLKETFY